MTLEGETRHTTEFVYQAVSLGIFEIDDEGRIWRVYMQQSSPWGQATKLVPCKRRRAEKGWNQQYLQLSVMLDGVLGITGAHRIVYSHFCGVIPVGLTINHKDGDKHNNHPNNLELATRSEQSRHAVHVLGWQSWKNMAGHNSQPGERNAMSKLNTRAVRQIRRSSAKGIELARQYCVAPSVISRVRSGQLWGHVK